MRTYLVVMPVMVLIAAGLLPAQTPTVNNVANQSTSGQAASTIAPGELLAVNGSNLSVIPGITCATSGVAYPNSCNGTSVTIGGRTAPLRSAGSGQLTIQVPIDLTNGSAAVVVSRVVNSVPVQSQPFNVTVAPTAPTMNPGCVDTAGVQFSDSKPAFPGDTVKCFGNGFGVTNPLVPTGAVHSQPAPAVVASVKVTVGGQTAALLSATLTAGSVVGLFQVRFVVPQGLTVGTLPVVVEVGGVSASPIILPVSKEVTFPAIPPADSVFVDGAFNGSWRPDGEPDFFTFQQIDEASGLGLLNSLGDPQFVQKYCPTAAQKREFYQAIPPEGPNFYACTNGTALFGRISDLPEIIVFQVTSVNPGPSPSFVVSSVSNVTGAEIGGVTYVSGGIATPLARVPPDQVTLLSVTPSSAVRSGAAQDFGATLSYKMFAHRQGTVRLVLSDEKQQVVATSTAVNVSLADALKQSTFQIPQVAVPAAAGLILRAEMRLPDGTLVASATSATISVVTPSPVQIAPTEARVDTAPTTKQLTATVIVTVTSAQPIAFSAAISGGSAWLKSVTPTSFTLSAGGVNTAFLSLAVDPQGLIPGVYLDSVQVTWASGTAKIPVILTIQPPASSIRVTPDGLRFESRQGQGSSVAQKLAVLSALDGSAVNWSARILSGSDVIQIDPLSGTTPVGSYSDLNVRLTGTATNKLGASYGVIEVSSPQFAPRLVTVVSDVAAATDPVVPLLSPSGLTFVATQGGAAAASQNLSLNVSDAAANFTTTVATADLGSWLTVSPAAGSVSTSAPAGIKVTASSAGLAPGGYRGAITFKIGNVTRVASVLLIVRPTGASEPVDKLDSRSATGCTATKIFLSETKLPGSFSAPVGWPASLTTQMFDDCGTALAGGSVIASFSNGDAPLRLIGDSVTGDYSASWEPVQLLAGQTTVTLNGTFSTLIPDVLEINGTVVANAQHPPVLTTNGILNNLNAVLGGPLAPGTVVQIYGDNLATVAESAASVPLPVRVKGTELLISGGYSAPLYYISPGQLVAQLPAELVADRTYSVLLTVNDVPSVPLQINVVSVQAGVAAYSDGRVIAQHGADYQLVTPDNPAKPGEVIIIYLVGMGATNPGVASGRAAPGDTLARAVIQPAVTIGGQPAQVAFAGLTPGGVGLYQINLTVPGSAASGDLDVVITQNGVATNATKVVVRK
ncbi:MAG: hypothetical protein ABI811_11735 [Acidobacteriota bacterium]